MACLQYKGITYGSEAELLNVLSQELLQFDITKSPILSIPDMVTKMDFVIDNNKFKMTYNEILLYLKNLDIRDVNIHLINILNGKIPGSSIIVPNIKYEYNKTYYGTNINDLSSNTILEHIQIEDADDAGEVTVGTKAYLEELGLTTGRFSIIEKKLPTERNLKGYQYKTVDNKNIDNHESVKAARELLNFKSEGKRFTKSIFDIYISDNSDMSREDADNLFKHYNSKLGNQELTEGFTVNDLTKDIESYLENLNIPLKTLTEEQLNNPSLVTIRNIERNNLISEKRNKLYSILRQKIISTIVNNDYKFVPAEVIGSLPNVEVLNIGEKDTISTIGETDAEIKKYFLNRETSNNRHLLKAPKGNLLFRILNDKITEKQLDKTVKQLREADFSEWPWFKKIQNYINNTDNITVKDLRTATITAIGIMRNEIADNSVDGYKASLVSIYTRIPSQAKQSSTISKIVWFDNTRGNFTVEALKSFLIKGEDNDGDKLNTLTKVLDIHGNVIQYNDYLDSNGNFIGINKEAIESFNINLFNDVKSEIESKYFKSKDLKDKLYELKSLQEKKKNNQLTPEEETALIRAENWYSKRISKLNINSILTEALKRKTLSISNYEYNKVLLSKLESIENTKQNFVEEKTKMSYLDALDIKSDSNKYNDARLFIQKIDAKVNKQKENQINLFSNAVKNYIFDQQVKIHSDPFNAIEKEIMVSNEDIDNILNSGSLKLEEKEDEQFDNNETSELINGVLSNEKAIHVGEGSVGPVAIGIRVASVLSEVAESSVDTKMLDLGKSIDLSYFTPIYNEETNDREYIKQPVIIDELRVVREVKKSRENNIIDFHKQDIDLFDYIKQNKESFNKGYYTTDQDIKAYFNKYKDIDFTNVLYNKQAFEALSELMNGAVDNAKLLILSKLGIDDVILPHVLTMINIGVSLKDSIAVINQKDIKKALLNSNINSNARDQSQLKFTNSLLKVEIERNKSNSKIAKSIVDKDIKETNLNLVKELSAFNDINFESKPLELSLLKIKGLQIDDATIVSDEKSSKISDDINKGIYNSEAVVFIVKNADDIKNQEIISQLDNIDKPVFVTTKTGNTIFYHKDGEMVQLKDFGNTDSNWGLNDIRLSGKLFVYSTFDLETKDYSNVIKLIKYTNTSLKGEMNSIYSNMKDGLSRNIPEEIKKVDVTHNAVTKFLNIIKISNEIGFLSKIMSFKNGNNNKQYDMRSYMARVEQSAKSLLKPVSKKLMKDFTLNKFIFDTEFRSKVIQSYNFHKTGINPFYVLTMSEDLFAYAKKLSSQETEITTSSNKIRAINKLDDKIFDKQVLRQRSYTDFNRAVNSLIVNDFLDSYFSKKTIKLETIDGKFDLSTKEDSDRFIKEFPTFIQNLQGRNFSYNKGVLNVDGVLLKENRKLRDNFFIQSITTNNGATNDKYGDAITFIGLKSDLTDKDKSALKIAAKELKEYKSDIYKALYLYDIIVNNNSYSQFGFSEYLIPENSYDIDNFLADYDFSKVEDIDPNYLILIRLGLLDDIEKSKFEKYKGEIKLKNITLNKQSFKRVPIIRDGSLHSYKSFITKSDIKKMEGKGTEYMLDKAGYKIGYQVNVKNPKENTEYRIINYNSKGKTYFINTVNLNNPNASEVIEITKDDLIDLNPNFIFEKEIFGPSRIVEQVKEKQVAKLSDDDIKSFINSGFSNKVMGQYNPNWSKYEFGDVIARSVSQKTGDAYELRYVGVKPLEDAKKQIDPNSFYGKMLNNNNLTKAERELIKKDFVFAEVFKTTNYFTVPGVKYVPSRITKNFNFLLKKSNINERPLMVYSTDELTKEVPFLKIKGNAIQTRPSDRTYVIRSRGVFNNINEAVEDLGYNSKDNKSFEEGKKQLVKLMNIDLTREHDSIVKWINTSNYDKKSQPIVLYDTIPQPEVGANNSAEELSYARELEINTKEALDILKGTSVVFQNTNPGNSERNVFASIFNRKTSQNISLKEDVLSKIEEDVKSIGFSINVDDSRNIASNNWDALSGNELNIIYVNDILTSKEGVKLSGLAQSLKRNASKAGVFNLQALHSDINFVLSNETLTNKDLKEKYNGRYSYLLSEIDLESNGFEELKSVEDEIKVYYNTSYGEEGNNTNNNIGKEQRVYSSDENDFLRFQTAKHVSSSENIPLYIINNSDGRVYLYDSYSGNTKPLSSVPNILGKQIGFIGLKSRSIDLIKLSVSKYNKGMDPGFVPYPDFIYNKEEESSLPVPIEQTNSVSLVVELNDILDTFEEQENKETLKVYFNHTDSSIDNNNYFVEDFKDIGDNFVLKQYKIKGQLINTLESDDSNTLYILDNSSSNKDIENFENVRVEVLDSIGEGTLQENYKIRFKTKTFGKSNILNFPKYYSAKRIYMADKQAFKHSLDTKGINTALLGLKEDISTFTYIKQSGFNYSFKEYLTGLKASLPNLDNAGNEVLEKNILSPIDFIKFVLNDKLDNYFNPNDNIVIAGNLIPYNKVKEDVLILNKKLISLKKKYYDKKYSLIDLHSVDIKSITSTPFDESKGYTKVYFNKQNYTNLNEISELNSDKDFSITESEIKKKEAYSINVANNVRNFDQKGIENQLQKFFYHIKSELKKNPNVKFYINFKEIKDGHIQTFYGSNVSYSLIARAFAKKLHNKEFYSLVKDGVINFNETATIEINNTDGYNSLRDINNNKEFSVSPIRTHNTSDLPFNLRAFNLMFEENNSIMDSYNKYFELKEGNKNLNLAVTETLNEREKAQRKLKDLYVEFFKEHPKVLIDFKMRLKSNDIYSYKGKKVSEEQAIVDIINDDNSIDFILNQESKSKDLPFDFYPEKKFFILKGEEELPNLGLKEGNAIPVQDKSKTFKLKYEYTNILPFDENGILDSKLRQLGFKKEDLLDLELKENEHIKIVSSNEVNIKYDIQENPEHNPAENIENNLIVKNVNLGEGSIDKATYVLPISVKDLTTNNSGILTSNDLKPYIDVYGNTIKTNLTDKDVVHIKSSHVGDIETNSNREYYDAYRKIRIYLDRITSINANIILSGGVTLNEYIKEYISSKGYEIDIDGIYRYVENKTSFEERLNNERKTIVYKYIDSETEGNRLFAINNNEKKKTSMPLIVHTQEDDAINYENKYRSEDNAIEEVNTIGINTDKIKKHDAIIDQSVKEKIVNKSIIKENFDKKLNKEAKLTKSALEQRAIAYIKTVIGFKVFGEDLDIETITSLEDAILQVNDYVKTNKDSENVHAYNKAVSKFIDINNNKLSVSGIKVNNILLNNNNTNEYLRLEGIDTKDLFYKYNILSELNNDVINFIDKKIRKRIVISQETINKLLEAKNVQALDLFLLTMNLNPETSFKNYYGNPMATMHLFVENGINGIELNKGEYSLFETMDVIYNNEPVIFGPKFVYPSVKRSLQSMFSILIKNNSSLAMSLNNTKLRNLPFIISGTDAIFNDGSIVSLFETTNFQKTLQKNILVKAMEQANIPLNVYNNPSEMIHKSIGFNLNSILKFSNNFNEININKIFFKKNNNELNATNYNESGSVISYTFKGDDNPSYGFIYLNDKGQSIVLFKDGITKKATLKNGKISLRSINDIDFDSDVKKVIMDSDFARPEVQKTYKRFYNYSTVDGNSKVSIVNKEMNVLSTGKGISGNTNYEFNKSLNAWIEVSAELPITFNAKEVKEGFSSEIKNQKDLEGVEYLLLDNSFVAKLSENAKLINKIIVDKDNDLSYIFNKKTMSYIPIFNEKENLFQFKSNIDKIQFNGNTIETQKLGKKQSLKVINRLAQMYPSVDIEYLNTKEISYLYGESKAKKGAFTINNKVIYNSDKFSMETAIHELAHIYLNNVRNTNPELYNLILEKTLENKALIKDIQKADKGLRDNHVLEEAFVTMVGFNAQGEMNNLTKEKTIWDSILDFFNNVINGIFGTNIENLDISNSLVEIVDKIGIDIVMNKSSLYTNLTEQEKIIIKDKRNSTDRTNASLRKLVSVGKIKMKSEIDYNIISSKNLKCN